MKKKMTGLFLLAGMLAAMTVTAHAETYYGNKDWHVTFTQQEKMESNFNTQDLSEAVSGLQPGDDIHLTVAIENANKEATDWYMKNDIRKSLEDASATASGGAYTYILTYTDSSGKVTELFNSDTVGGEDVSEAGEGLNEATSALDEYFYLDSLKNGQKGQVDLTVALEGETQGNGYQDTLAELELSYAVEPAEPDQPYEEERQPRDTTESTTTNSNASRVHSVKTGDTEIPSGYLMLMAAGGCILLFLAIRNHRQGREERKGAA